MFLILYQIFCRYQLVKFVEPEFIPVTDRSRLFYSFYVSNYNFNQATGK
jgi:hypothetical protein